VNGELIPMLRGVSHAWAFWCALVAGTVLTLYAPSGTARAAAIVYGAGLCALFAASGLYHRWRWNPRWRPVLRRVDHSTIFVFIAGTYTPFALLAFEGATAAALLAGVWCAALFGLAVSLCWIDAPTWAVTAAYLLVGWVGVLSAPQLFSKLGIAAAVLVIVGGILYTAGAVIYALRRPDPVPAVFGYHELFHVLVIAAAAAQFVAVSLVVL
jgi:hemolysin III